MAPQHKKTAGAVLRSRNKDTPRKRSANPKGAALKTTLSPAESISTILNKIGRRSAQYLSSFQTPRTPSPLVSQCAAINTPSYSWVRARARHKKREARITYARERPEKQQYHTNGSKTRVWVPKWPNETPALENKFRVPEDRHSKSREAIVRIVQDQEEVTRKMHELCERSNEEGFSLLSIEDQRIVKQQHLVSALRLEGIEVIEWVEGTPGWKMEVYFQPPESWKGEWGY